MKHTVENPALIDEMRRVAVTMFQQNGPTPHTKLLGRAIKALINESSAYRDALATELDSIGRGEMTPAEREVIAKACQQLRCLAADRSNRNSPLGKRSNTGQIRA